jgi:hypothetical protein
MNTAEILRGLLRRWYVVVPGVLLSAALALTAWTSIGPSYERTARQLLLPGTTSIPEGGNPYLYIGGLSQAADVVVLALGSNNVLDEIAEEHPDVEVEVTRDTSTSSPVIVITVTGPSDAEAEAVLDVLVDRTAVVLTDLQDQEQIAADNRITVNTVTVDGQSVVQQKDRMITAAGVAVGGVVVSIVLAALVDGLVISRRRRSSASRGHGAKPAKGGVERRRSPGPDDEEWLDADDPEAALTEDVRSEGGSEVTAEDHLGVAAEDEPSESDVTVGAPRNPRK